MNCKRTSSSFAFVLRAADDLAAFGAGRGRALQGALLLAGLCALACSKKEESPAAEQKAPAPVYEKTEVKQPAVEEKPKRPPPSIVPQGPEILVMPGKGFAATRFGATIETIERQMQAPCEFKPEGRCVYVDRALEFFLGDKGLEKIRVHLRGQSSEDVPGAERDYGLFRGFLPPEIRPGLHKHIVISEYGEADKVEKPKKVTTMGLQERHFYDGIILEYDRIDNGNIVLGAMEIFPSETAEDPFEYLRKLHTKRKLELLEKEAAKKASE